MLLLAHEVPAPAVVMPGSATCKTNAIEILLHAARKTEDMAAQSTSLDSQDPTLVAAGSLGAPAPDSSTPRAAGNVSAPRSARHGLYNDPAPGGYASQCSDGSMQRQAVVGLAAQSRPQWREPASSLRDGIERASTHTQSDADARKGRRMMWSDALHRQFLQSLTDIGLRHAVPKTIMQRMRAPELTRENVASHLQKYRLMLKRAAHLSANAVMDADAWSQLEAAHARHVSNLAMPLNTAMDSAVTLSPCTHREGPCIGGMAGSAALNEPSLPPLGGTAPTGEKLSVPRGRVSPAVQARFSSCGLPLGFSIPQPNAAGEAVGIPMPLHMVPGTPVQPGGAVPPSSGAAAIAAQPLPPLALPATPSALMPPGFSYTQLAENLGAAEGCPGGLPQTCRVFMLDQSAQHAPSSAAAMPWRMTQAQVPQMMFAVSAAAYRAASTLEGTAVQCATDIADGAVRPAHSSRSASRPASPAERNELSATAETARASARCARRTVAEVLPSEDSKEGPPRRRQRRVHGGGRAMSRLMAASGSCDGLDVLAEVAEQLASSSGK